MRNIKLVPLLLTCIGAVVTSAKVDAVVSFIGSPSACTTGLRSDLQPAPGADVRTAVVNLSFVDRPENGAIHVGTREATFKMWPVSCGGEKSLLVGRIEDSLKSTGPSNLVFPYFHLGPYWVNYGIVASNPETGTWIWPSSVDGIGTTFIMKLATYISGSADPSRYMLEITDGLADVSQTTRKFSVQMPTFVPQAYPDSVGPRPINGRYAGNFFDPAKPGEGMVVEIGDVAGTDDDHFLQFAWHSFDNTGAPFWISGGTSFTGRPRHLTMPSAYREGGRFGGARAAQTQTAWGTVDIEFSDCGTAVIDYTSNANLPPKIPSGSGHLQWKRLTSVSGYSCD